MFLAEPRYDYALQVCFLGAKGSGKTTAIRSAIRDAALTEIFAEESLDGLGRWLVVYDHHGIKVKMELIDISADPRYAPTVPFFVNTAAALVLIADCSAPTCIQDLKSQMEIAGTSAPRSGVIIANKEFMPAAGDGNQILEQVQECADSWGLRLLQYQTLLQIQGNQILNAICSLALREIPESGNPDALQLLGSRISRGVQTKGV